MSAPATANAGHEPRFRPGDQVRIDSRDALGHCRTPYYLRGKTGAVVAIDGPFRDPEKLAYHLPGVPTRYLYRIAFRQAALWPDYRGSAADTLEADIFENWLAPTGQGSQS